MAESEIAKKLINLTNAVDKTLSSLGKELQKVAKAAKELKESVEKEKH
jgi:uncharacterized phage infection (PIP) family protein YhgE